MVVSDEEVYVDRQVFEIFTLFPEVVQFYTGIGLIARGIKKNKIAVYATNIRDYAIDRQRRVDDTPFGGGAGMVIQAAPVVNSLEHIESLRGPMHRILLTPSAPIFDQRTAERLAQKPRLGLICGRYEGIDDRVRQSFVDECLSIGDFVLNGGELAALVIMESVARLQPGVLGNPDSLEQESFASLKGGCFLEYPQFTRPSLFRGAAVPKVLLSGNHEDIAKWRRRASCIRTWQERPGLRKKPQIREGTPMYFAVISSKPLSLPEWKSSFSGVSDIFKLSGAQVSGQQKAKDLPKLMQLLRKRHSGYKPVLIAVKAMSMRVAGPSNNEVEGDDSTPIAISAAAAIDVLIQENKVSEAMEPLVFLFADSGFDQNSELATVAIDIVLAIPDPSSFGLANSPTIEESSRPRTSLDALNVARNTVLHLREIGILPESVSTDLQG